MLNNINVSNDDDMTDGEGEGGSFETWLDLANYIEEVATTVMGAESIVRRLSGDTADNEDLGLYFLANLLRDLYEAIERLGRNDRAGTGRDLFGGHIVSKLGYAGWDHEITEATTAAGGIAKLLRNLGQVTDDAGLRLLAQEMAGVRLRLARMHEQITHRYLNREGVAA